MTTLTELKERLEKASGPDREIDAALFEYFDPEFPTGAFRMPLAIDAGIFGTGAYTNC